MLGRPRFDTSAVPGHTVPRERVNWQDTAVPPCNTVSTETRIIDKSQRQGLFFLDIWKNTTSRLASYQCYAVLMSKRELYESLGILLSVPRRPPLIRRHTPCEISPPTHTLPDLSEVMKDHNLMETLGKHAYAHSNLWYLMLRVVGCAEKPGTEECKICTWRGSAV